MRAGGGAGIGNRRPNAVAGSCRLRLHPAGIHKIQHHILVMQQNRSSEIYFGTRRQAGG